MLNDSRIYLDYNATSLIRNEVIISFEEIIKNYGNPSSVHSEGRRANMLINNSRKNLAELINSKTGNIVFTSGGTEAIDIALNQSSDRILINPTEHIAVHDTAQKSFSNIEEIKINSDGVIDLNNLEKLMKKRPCTVAVMMANNETGVIQPIKKISKIVHDYGGIIFCDAIQALGKLEVDFDDLDVDIMSISSHKIGGISGTGAIIFKSEIEIKPRISGGGQEFNIRGGTQNVLGISAFGEAAKISRFNEEEDKRIKQLRDEFERRVTEIGAEIFSKNEKRLSNTSYFAFKENKAETMIMKLDLGGFSVSSGSACSSGKVSESHVLRAMGVKPNLRQNAIRVSLGWGSKLNHIDKVCDFLKSQIRN